VVDATKLQGQDTTDFKQYQAALALQGKNADIVSLVKQWLVLPMSQASSSGAAAAAASSQSDIDIATAGVRVNSRTSTLHIQYRSLMSLSNALLAFPFLVRCGTLPGAAQNQWAQKEVCGPVVDKLPELIRCQHRFTGATVPLALASHVLPADLATQQQLLRSQVDGVLAAHQVSTSLVNVVLNNRTYRAGAPESLLVRVDILPRDFKQRQAVVSALHNQLVVGDGAKLRCHCPNYPPLHRCNQCEELGHTEDNCPVYGGVGFRLLFKTKVPFQFVQSVAQLTGAFSFYLGSGIQEFAPSHRTTFLFQGQEHDASFMENVISKFNQVITMCHQDLLQVYVVKPRDRHKECQDCGSMEKPSHDCYFRSTVNRQALPHNHSASSARLSVNHTTLGSRNTGIQSALALADLRISPENGATPSAVRLPHAANETQSGKNTNGMCRSWEQNKSCPRQSKGVSCRFSHPEDHVPAPQECHQFRETGACRFGATCKYSHDQGTGCGQVTPTVTTSITSAATDRVTLSPAAPTASVAVSNSFAVLDQPPEVDEDEHKESTRAPAASSFAASRIVSRSSSSTVSPTTATSQTVVPVSSLSALGSNLSLRVLQSRPVTSSTSATATAAAAAAAVLPTTPTKKNKRKAHTAEHDTAPVTVTPLTGGATVPPLSSDLMQVDGEAALPAAAAASPAGTSSSAVSTPTAASKKRSRTAATSAAASDPPSTQ